MRARLLERYEESKELPYLFFLLGMSTWFAFSTISSQAPVFTSCKDYSTKDEEGSCDQYLLPEGLKFSSYINVASQLGNLLPFLYRILCNRREYVATFVSLALGIVSLMVAAFCWHISVYMGHELGHKSLILMLCTFFCGASGSLNSVLFWRIASYFSVNCVRYQSIGSAFGGVFPMAVALLQLDDPRLTFILGSVAQIFFVLTFFRIYLEFEKTRKAVHDEEEAKATNIMAEDSSMLTQQEHFSKDTLLCGIGFSLYFCAYSIPSFIPLMTNGYKFSKRLYTFINVAYTCGDVLGRALTSFERLKRPNIRSMISLTLVAFAVYGMLLFAACAVDSFEKTILPGEVSNLLIFIFFVFYCVRGYVVTSLYIHVRLVSSSKEESAVRSGRMGYVAQFGAAVGALGSFLVLNV